MGGSFWEGLKGIFTSLLSGLGSITGGSGGNGLLLTIVSAVAGGAVGWNFDGAIGLGIGLLAAGLGAAALTGFTGMSPAETAKNMGQKIAANPELSPIKDLPQLSANISNLHEATNKILADRINKADNSNPPLDADSLNGLKAQEEKAHENINAVISAGEEIEKKNPQLEAIKNLKAKIIKDYGTKYAARDTGDIASLENRSVAQIMDAAETELQNRILDTTRKIRADNEGKFHWVGKNIMPSGPVNNISYAVDDYLLKYLNEGNYKLWADQAEVVNSYTSLGTWGSTIAKVGTWTAGGAAGGSLAGGVGTVPGAIGGAIVGTGYSLLTEWAGRDPNNLDRFRKLSELVKDYHNLQNKRSEILEVALREVKDPAASAVAYAAEKDTQISQQNRAAAERMKELYQKDPVAWLDKYINDPKFGLKEGDKFVDPNDRFIQELYQHYVKGEMREPAYLERLATQFAPDAAAIRALKDEKDDKKLIHAIAAIADKNGIRDIASGPYDLNVNDAKATADLTVTRALDTKGDLRNLDILKGQYQKEHPAPQTAILDATRQVREALNKQGVGGATHAESNNPPPIVAVVPQDKPQLTPPGPR